MNEGLVEQVRADAVEQLLRVSDDMSLAWAVQTASSKEELLAVIGRLLADVPLTLLSGSPFVAMLGYTPLDPQWRRFYPPRPNSLFNELELFVELGMVSGVSLTELEQAREDWMLDTGAPIRP